MSARRPTESIVTHYAEPPDGEAPWCGAKRPCKLTFVTDSVTCPRCRKILIQDAFHWGAEFLRKYRQ